jgi:hypothetical protein
LKTSEKALSAHQLTVIVRRHTGRAKRWVAYSELEPRRGGALEPVHQLGIKHQNA